VNLINAHAVEHKGGGAIAGQRTDDGVQRCLIDDINGAGAKEPIRELIKRGLLRRMLGQRRFGQFARSDVARNLRGANDCAAGVHDRRDAQ